VTTARTVLDVKCPIADVVECFDEFIKYALVNRVNFYAFTILL
jgi:hypothetical protein